MAKKVLYYLYITLCVALVILHVITVGWSIVRFTLISGLYSEEYTLRLFGVRMTDGYLLWVNRAAGFFLWLSIILPLLLLPIKRVTQNVKMNISLICFGILITVGFLPKLIGWINHL